MNKVFIWCICSVISGLSLYCVFIYTGDFFFFFQFFTWHAEVPNFTISPSPPPLTFIMVIVNTVPLLNISFCWVAKCLGWGQFVPHCPIMPDACGYTIWSIHELICILGHEFHSPSPPLLLCARFEAIMTLQQMKRTKIVTAHLWGWNECRVCRELKEGKDLHTGTWWGSLPEGREFFFKCCSNDL